MHFESSLLNNLIYIGVIGWKDCLDTRFSIPLTKPNGRHFKWTVKLTVKITGHFFKLKTKSAIPIEIPVLMLPFVTSARLAVEVIWQRQPSVPFELNSKSTIQNAFKKLRDAGSDAKI